MLNAVLGGVSLSFLSIYLYYRYPGKLYGMPQVPSPPILGIILKCVEKNRTLSTELQKVYGNEFVASQLGRPVTFLLGEEGSRWIFKGENKYVIGSWPEFWKDILGRDSVSVACGETHKHLRSILSNSFTSNMLRSYFPVADAMMQKFLRMMAADSAGGTPVEVYPYARQMVFDVAAKIFLNIDSGEESKAFLADFSVYITGLSSILPYDLPFLTYGKSMGARRKLEGYIRRKIAAKREEQGASKQAFDFLATLLEAKDEEGKMLHEDQIISNILTFMFAGHDTLTATCCSIFEELARNQRVKDKLIEEIQEFFPNGEGVTFERLGDLPYLEAFTKEMLRYYSPIASGMRETAEEVTYKDYTLPKGSVVSYSIHHAHLTEFPDPELFEPERFLEPRNEDKKSTYAFIPFGNGPRMCIGLNLARLEIKLFTIRLLQSYDVKVTENKFVQFPIYRCDPKAILTEK